MNADTVKYLLHKNKGVLEREFGILHIGIFGSVATGTADRQSDIDLFYDLEKGKFLTLRQLEAFEQRVKRILQSEKVELVNLRYMNPIVRHRAEKHFIYV